MLILIKCPLIFRNKRRNQTESICNGFQSIVRSGSVNFEEYIVFCYLQYVHSISVIIRPNQGLSICDGPIKFLVIWHCLVWRIYSFLYSYNALSFQNKTSHLSSINLRRVFKMMRDPALSRCKNLLVLSLFVILSFSVRGPPPPSSINLRRVCILMWKQALSRLRNMFFLKVLQRRFLFRKKTS